jgi:Tfp pilus assembly protein PilF
MKPSVRILWAVMLLLMAGCASQTSRNLGIDKLSPRKAEQELSTGIHNYEDGNYKTASRQIQTALNDELTFTSDKVRAHKYLAFIYCTSERERQCREEFRKAFELDPAFKLEPAESGHPMWGPVYRSVQAEMQTQGKSPR